MMLHVHSGRGTFSVKQADGIGAQIVDPGDEAQGGADSHRSGSRSQGARCGLVKSWQQREARGAVMASNRRGVLLGLACAWMFTGVLTAQEPCVPAPLFSGNVALGMPFQADAPNVLLGSHSRTHGDFDNDGDIDVMHGTDDGSLVFFRCRGDWWDFEPPVIIDLPFTPPPPGGIWLITALAPADFNSDGKIDLAIGDTWIYWQSSPSPAQRVHVMLGNGDGTFQAATAWGPDIAAGVGDLCISDFNGDGHQDIGYGSDEGGEPGKVGIIWGAGGGTFPTFTVIHTGVVASSSAWLDAADIDGDGDQDVVAEVPSTEPAILRNTGTGNFGIEPLGAQGWGYTFGELNGDGKPDIVLATHGNCLPPVPAMVHVRLNNGAGQFLPPVSYAVTTQPCQTDVIQKSSPMVADLNGDGRAEVAIGRGNPYGLGYPTIGCSATQFQDQVLVFRNAGNGTLVEPPVLRHIVGSNVPPLRLAAADLNADGRADIVGSDRQATTLLLNDGNGGFLTNYGVPIGPIGSCNTDDVAYRLLTNADMNGDGRFDLVGVREVNPPLDVTVILQDPQGGFTTLLHHPVPERFSTGLAIADFDRDGHQDLALSTHSQSTPFGGRTVRTAKGHGDGTFDPWVPHQTVGFSPRHVAAGNLNADQWPDMVVATRYDGATPPQEPGGFSVFLNNGAGGFLPAVHYQAAGAKWTDIADLNADGHPDLGVTWGPDLGTPAGMRVFLNNGNGTFTPNPTPFEHEFPSRVRFTDVNADGSLDLLFTLGYLWLEPASGGLVVALNDGSGVFQQSAHLGLHLDYTNQGPGAADFDADGHVDVAISAGTWGIIDLYRGNGDGTFQKAISYGAGRSLPAGESIIVHDFDGDGRPDLGSPLGCSVSKDTNTHVGFSILLNRTCEAPCYPDCNLDGSLTVADFGCFQTRFVQQHPYADCNGVGGLTVADFGCFQTKFVQGCP